MFLTSKSQPKLGQVAHVGGVLKMSRPADFKSVPGFENQPRFDLSNRAKKIQQNWPLLYNQLGHSKQNIKHNH